MKSTPLYYGFNAPFLLETDGVVSQVLPRQVDERLIRNDLLQLLLTNPGERVMRPGFGSGIRAFLFDQIDDVGLTRLKQNILAAIAQYERRVTATDVALTVDANIVMIRVFGYFNLDRFSQPGQAADIDLLVELNIPTAASPAQT
jgi:phage baseplate assembly protein W